jgi:hypothetical protein
MERGGGERHLVPSRSAWCRGRGAAGADIADGYHRVSLVYRIDPLGEVPLKLA